jgi:HSP20 family protein
MRQRIHAITFPSEVADFSDEVRQVYHELGRVFASDSLASECSPTIDVYETDDAVEIVVDLPGTAPSAVRVLSKGDAILVIGEKPPRRVRGESTFHLVERGYGRFARAVRVSHTCDTARARAVLVEGELRISLPKIPDRRGHAVTIAITNGASGV